MDENKLKMQHSPLGRKISRVVLNPNIWFAVLLTMEKQRVQTLIKKPGWGRIEGRIEQQELALQEIIRMKIVFLGQQD